MEIDSDFIGGFAAFLFVCTVAVAVVILIIGAVVVQPKLQDKAQRMCVEQGYETYIDYTNVFLSTNVRALYCGTYAQRMIKEGKISAYQTNGNNSIIVSDLNKQR